LLSIGINPIRSIAPLKNTSWICDILSLCSSLPLFCLSFWPFFFVGHTCIPSQAPLSYTYRVVNTYPHDRFAFTEGLAYRGGMLVESTGLEGNSTIRIVNLTTGSVIMERHLPETLFGEGATVSDRIAQETETSGFGILYDVSTLTPLGTFPYSTEGWGITFDGSSLIMSAGTSSLYFLDPETFRHERTISVTDRGMPVQNRNELEYINGEVYANIWPTYDIAIISPKTGQVTGWIDLDGILSPKEQRQVGWSAITSLDGNTSIPFSEEDCPNGIAYDPGGNRLFVTGKLWPTLYQIELIEEGKVSE
jgi:glutamine cyclotransferase